MKKKVIENEYIIAIWDNNNASNIKFIKISV